MPTANGTVPDWAALEGAVASPEALASGLRLAARSANVPSLRELVRCAALFIPLTEPPTPPERTAGPLLQVTASLRKKASAESLGMN